MSQNSRKGYLREMRWTYGNRTGKQGKPGLIVEFCEVTGHEREYAVKMLRCHRRDLKAPHRKTGRKPAYGE